MRFSDALLRQVRDRVSIADYAGKRLSWNKQKTRPAAGDYWACCPFHQEKTPSFHVLDQKGIFHCFGCGEKGDVFTLAMRLEGLSFPEAVEKLADLAGVPLPRDDEDRGDSERRARLQQIVARTARLYAEALLSSGGAEARRYLQGRGLGAEEWARFGIGFAPPEWTWTLDKLKSEGFHLEDIVAAGVARAGEDGKRAIDVFRNRVTFEIGDAAGKIIGFGGRALDPDAHAKYINSPETTLYSKSRVLYRLKQARELMAKTKAAGLVVAEGYLDVIAFERAGIAAVAPCGTAVTEEQLMLLWRAGGEPVMCFDGDAAGQRAADKALDLALPHFGPGRTLKFAYAPSGEDPDDIFRRAGPVGLSALIAAAAPAIDALFARERRRHALSTPESRAAFQAALREAANRIADRDTQRAYFAELTNRAYALSRAARAEGPSGGRKWGRQAPPPGASPELKAQALNPPRPAAEAFLRAAVDHPGVLARFSDWIDRLAIADPDLGAIRAALVSLSQAAPEAETIDRAVLSLHLTRLGQERAAARVLRWPKARPPAEATDVEAEWLALATREVVLPAIREELAELRAQAAEGDEAAFARFQRLSREAQRIEARAREAKLDDVQEDDADGLVA